MWRVGSQGISTGKIISRLWQLPHPGRSRGAIIILQNSEAIAMTYDENRNPEISVFKEIVCNWTFAASLVGVIFIVLDIVH